MHSWQAWFAWRPVELTRTGQRVWLCRIYRRPLYRTYRTQYDLQGYEYGTILDTVQLPPEAGHQR